MHTAECHHMEVLCLNKLLLPYLTCCPQVLCPCDETTLSHGNDLCPLPDLAPTSDLGQARPCHHTHASCEDRELAASGADLCDEDLRSKL